MTRQGFYWCKAAGAPCSLAILWPRHRGCDGTEHPDYRAAPMGESEPCGYSEFIEVEDIQEAGQ